MSKIALSLFKANAAIGIVQGDGSVLPSQEFVRAMSMLFERVGGAIGMGVDDLALLAAQVTQPDQVARRAAADATAAPAIDQSALVAALLGKVAALAAQVAQIEGVHAEVAQLRKRLAGAELQAGHRDPHRVNWERPGRIGFFAPNTGAFTALTATTVNRLTLTPPATGATLTIANGKTLTAVNSIALAGVDGVTLTVNNTLGFTATPGAFLDIGNGGTLGTAAYKNVASDWAVQRFGCNGAAASARITVTGSRGGNAALASVLTALATFGFITDSTTA